MLTNLTYLAVGSIALTVVAKAAPPQTLIAAAIAIVAVVAIATTVSHGPDTTISLIEALTQLLRGGPSG